MKFQYLKTIEDSDVRLNHSFVLPKSNRTTRVESHMNRNRLRNAKSTRSLLTTVKKRDLSLDTSKYLE